MLIINKIINKLSELKTRRHLSKSELLLLRQIKSQNLTYLSEIKLAKLILTIKEVKENQIEGIFIEAGCALGGSTILISRIKESTRIFKVFDVFGMIPPPSGNDTKEVHERYESIVNGNSKGLGTELYYGYQSNLFETVNNNLRNFEVDLQRDNVLLIQGLIQNTMRIKSKIAFAHIDVDWYDPVMYSLQEIWPNLSKGGSIILDDYNDWGGCRKAVDYFLSFHENEYIKDDSNSSVRIIKK